MNTGIDSIEYHSNTDLKEPQYRDRWQFILPNTNPLQMTWPVI